MEITTQLVDTLTLALKLMLIIASIILILVGIITALVKQTADNHKENEKEI